jgi:serine/threonine protein kinase
MELRIARKYRIGHKIGEGAFGIVYHGTDISTGQDVAIKLEERRRRHQLLCNEPKVYKTLQGLGKLARRLDKL